MLSALDPGSLLIAFTLGLFSTLHCWGMCGGIITALSLNLSQPVRARKSLLLAYTTAFNLGRIVSYALAGLLGGLLGSLVVITTVAGGLFILQLLAGVVLVFAGLRLAGWSQGLALLERMGQGVWRKLQPFGRSLLPVNTLPRALAFGMIWGFLPCGLVYSALLLAVATGDAIAGGSLMLGFGLGTLPGMVAAGFVSGRLQHWLQKPRLRQIAGIILIGFGLLVPLLHLTGSHGHEAHQHSHGQH
ncbi:MAG: sulfite exporter TauE/SafE family protein [Gammaproteobacteria bacterium]